jgi:hypothetical protein
MTDRSRFGPTHLYPAVRFTVYGLNSPFAGPRWLSLFGDTARWLADVDGLGPSERGWPVADPGDDPCAAGDWPSPGLPGTGRRTSRGARTVSVGRFRLSRVGECLAGLDRRPGVFRDGKRRISRARRNLIV